MRTRICLLVGALAATVGAWAQAPQVVEIGQEPHHSLLLDNAKVRVFLEEVGPQKQTQSYKEPHDFVEIALTDSNISIERNGMHAPRQLDRGDTHFIPGGGVRAVSNRETVQTYRAVIVEVRGGMGRSVQVYDTESASTYYYDTFKLPLEPGKDYTVTYDTPVLHAEKVQILAGAGIPSHSHGGDTLLVAVTDLELSHPAAGKPTPEVVRLNQGDVLWVAGGLAYPITNTGSRPAQFVTLEFQP